MSEAIERNIECPDCGAGRGLTVYDDGGTHCFACQKTHKNVSTTTTKPKLEKQMDFIKGTTPDSYRSIGHKALSHYGVTQGIGKIEGKPEIPMIFFPYDGGFKTRNVKDKEFSQHNMKGQTGQLFGKDRFSSGGKYLTITEGELDALTMYQAFGEKYPCVSLTSSSAVNKCVELNYKWIDSFDNIIVAFDGDEVGIKAAKLFSGKFAPGKVKIMKFNEDTGFKDANDYAQKNKWEELRQLFWSAEPYSPSEIVNGRELIDLVVENPIPECYDLPWDDLNAKTFGCRMQELWSIKAPPKVGKTSFLFEISKFLKDNTDFSVGTFFLEEPNKDSAIKFASLYADKRLYLPNVESTPEERRKAADQAFGDGKVWFYDDFGGMDFDGIVGHIRFYAQALECKFIIIDHISLLATSQDGDERKNIDMMADTLKRLTIELDCCIFIVSHVNDDGKFRGSRALQQLSNMVISLDRDKTSPDEDARNLMNVVVEESRFSGETGPVKPLMFNKDTGRLEEYTDELDE